MAVRFLVAMLSASDLLLFAKHLFVAAKVTVAAAGGSKDDRWDLLSAEFGTGLGFSPDGRGASPAWLSRASKEPRSDAARRRWLRQFGTRLASEDFDRIQWIAAGHGDCHE
jgi:hypothetical protein